MILKGAQRAGGRQLAAHLLNDRDNDHVTVFELRGFVASDLHGAFQEAQAVSRGTKCQQYLFSLSLNPPKDGLVNEADFRSAADAAEKKLGLEGQPRAIVIHEKEGRRHAHAVWSRIDAEAMRAVNLPHFKRKLTDLSRDLYLTHDWSLPDGLRHGGGKSPFNFTLAEWQQAKRHGLDPREVKSAIRDAWTQTDTALTLRDRLDERGYFLAQGDRRAVVVVDIDGGVHAFARMAGVRTKDIRDRLPDPSELPTLDQTRADLKGRIASQVRAFVKEIRVRQARDLAQDRAKVATLIDAQRAERGRLETAQRTRWEDETRDRAARFRTGLAGLWDSVTGRKAALHRQNEADAITSLDRDRRQRDDLAALQMKQRQPYQLALERLRARHADERATLMRDALAHWRRFSRRDHDGPEQTTARARRGLSLDL